MTRLVKGPGTDTLEREYVYADPPVSISDLAEKHGLSRSNVADKARVGKWYEKREAFRTRVGEKARDAMAERWAEFQTANYERLMKMAATYLDKYQAELENDKVKVSTRDMLGIAAMMRTFLSDMASEPERDPRIVSPDGEVFEGTEEEARDVMAEIRRLMAGGGDAGAEPTAE